MPKIKVNQKCPCGSGKKYKKCCLKRQVDAENSRNISPPPSIQEYLNQNPTMLKKYMWDKMYFKPPRECIQMVLMNKWDTYNHPNKVISQSKYVKEKYINDVAKWNNGVAPVKLWIADKKELGWENCCYTNAFGYACMCNQTTFPTQSASVVMGLNITALPPGIADSSGTARIISMETHAVVKVNGKLMDITPDFDGLLWKWFVPIKEWTDSVNPIVEEADYELFNAYKRVINQIVNYVKTFSGTKGFVYNDDYQKMDRIYYNPYN